MHEVKSFDEVLFLLKSQTAVVQIVQGMPVYFVKREDKIKAVGKNVNYMLSEEEFIRLFKQEKFYEMDQKGKEEGISLLKDEEYYSWKHK